MKIQRKKRDDPRKMYIYSFTANRIFKTRTFLSKVKRFRKKHTFIIYWYDGKLDYYYVQSIQLIGAFANEMTINFQLSLLFYHSTPPTCRAINDQNEQFFIGHWVISLDEFINK